MSKLLHSEVSVVARTVDGTAPLPAPVTDEHDDRSGSMASDRPSSRGRAVPPPRRTEPAPGPPIAASGSDTGALCPCTTSRTAGRSDILVLWCRNRSRRVIVLLMAVVVLSLADLAVTLAHLRSIGMMEANPLAVYIIKTTGSPSALAAFKIFTVSICVAVLYKLRRRVQGEIAAWCAVLILAGMSLIWHGYTESLEAIDPVELTQVEADDANWVLLD